MRWSPVPRRLVLLSTLAVGLAAAAIHGRVGAGVARAEDAGGTPAAPAPASAPDPTDSAVLRRSLLPKWDAQIDAAAAKAHLDARLTLDAVAPIPYLGVDADPVEGGMKLTHIDPGTAAEAAGLWAGHVLVAVRGDRVASGLRRTLPGARVEVKADDDRWHTRSVRAEGAKITATMDDGPAATGYDTFLTHGRVGVWTKSDSRSDFDDLRFEPLAAPVKEPAK